MKIRTDFVSNSSSSSFMVFGNLHQGEVEVEDFQTLGDDETFFIVLRDAGNDGDYIFELTPDLKMDLDMHQIDLTKHGLMVIRARYICGECCHVSRASDCYNWWEDAALDFREKLRRKSRIEGISVDGTRVFELDKDNDNPSDRYEIVDSIKNYDYDKYHSWESPNRENPF